jgi:hypothetical protein
MNVVPFLARHGLAPTELASLVTFANEIDISIETGATEEGWAYAALDLGPCYGIADGDAVWVVSREQSRIVVYDEEDDMLLSFKTVAEFLTAFRRLIPARQSQVG